jgi:hypothetical protein
LIPVIELHYLPCLAYFSVLINQQEVLIEKHEHFNKQTFRNRCYIKTAQRIDPLIIPLTGKHGKVPVKEVRIDYSQKWLNNHWRAIQSAYGKSPYFEFYAEDLHEVLFMRFDLLYDLNFSLLTMCLKWLRSGIKVKETLSYQEQYAGDVHDLRSCISLKDTRCIERVYRPAPYLQVFGNSFVGNLSIVDLIFCSGPEASRILKLSSGLGEQLQN